MNKNFEDDFSTSQDLNFLGLGSKKDLHGFACFRSMPWTIQRVDWNMHMWHRISMGCTVYSTWSWTSDYDLNYHKCSSTIYFLFFSRTAWLSYASTLRFSIKDNPTFLYSKCWFSSYSTLVSLIITKFHGSTGIIYRVPYFRSTDISPVNVAIYDTAAGNCDKMNIPSTQYAYAYRICKTSLQLFTTFLWREFVRDAYDAYTNTP